MFVYHPCFDVNTLNMRHTNQYAMASCIVINTIFAAFFILPRPTTPDQPLQILPTINNPFWRPSSYIFRRLNMTDAAIHSAHRQESMRRPIKQMAAQLNVSEDHVRNTKLSTVFRDLESIDRLFYVSYFETAKPTIAAEYEFSKRISNSADSISYSFPYNIRPAVKGMITALAERHKRICSLSPTMPLERMRAIV